MGPEAGASRPELRIGLLGPYSSANLGDTSIQMSVMAALRRRMDGIRFIGIATAPEDVTRTHGISAIDISGEPHGPGRDFTAKALRALWPGTLRRFIAIWRATAHIDALVISGSGQIDDHWGGPWRHPFRLLVWSLCARLRGIPVAVFGIGVDDLTTRIGAWMSVRAMRLAHFRAFRDSGSLARLNRLGMKTESLVCPDPAFGLEIGSMAADNPAKALSESLAPAPYAILSPIARNAWPGGEDAAYEKYLGALADLGRHLLDRGLDVRFACSQTRMDTPIVDRVLAKMGPEAADRCSRMPIATVSDYVRAAAGARLVTASRLHGVILALVSGTPVLAVAAPRKVRQVMTDLGLAECWIDLREADGAGLSARADMALEREASLRGKIAAQRRDLRAALGKAYDGLVAALLRAQR
jgi:polysaccharide pyruvyl transferase WcaK-like protein